MKMQRTKWQKFRYGYGRHFWVWDFLNILKMFCFNIKYLILNPNLKNSF